MAGRVQTGSQGQDDGGLRVRGGGEHYQGVPVNAGSSCHPNHQPEQCGDQRRGLRGAEVRQEDKVKVEAEDLRVAHQREGPEPAGGEDELHQGLAELARARHQLVRGEVPRGEEGGASRGRLQQGHEDVSQHGGSYQDMEILHHEGLECELGDSAYDDPV